MSKIIKYRIRDLDRNSGMIFAVKYEFNTSNFNDVKITLYNINNPNGIEPRSDEEHMRLIKMFINSDITDFEPVNEKEFIDVLKFIQSFNNK